MFNTMQSDNNLKVIFHCARVCENGKISSYMNWTARPGFLQSPGLLTFHVQKCIQSISMNLFMLFFFLCTIIDQSRWAPSKQKWSTARPRTSSGLSPSLPLPPAPACFCFCSPWPLLPPFLFLFHFTICAWLFSYFWTWWQRQISNKACWWCGHATNKTALINTSHPHVFRPVNMKRSQSGGKSPIR